MANDVMIEQIRAARDITVALVGRALVPFTEEELMQPKKLAMKIGSVYAGVYDAVKNPGTYLKG
jgi:wyosine [tRNA(Phe)-imidazoG37] synthetase (radical SAM superfamily)